MIKACLFDLYGTLFSDAKKGGDLPGGGTFASWNDSVDELNNAGIDPMDARSRVNDPAKAFFARSGSLSPERFLPGALDFVKELHRNGIKLASTSTDHRSAHALSRTGLYGFFDYVVDPVQMPLRPSADALLHAVRHLGVPKSDCIAFEHTSEGIEAAHRAGIRCVVVGDLNHLHQDAAMGVRSLEDFSLSKLKDGVEVSAYQC